MKSRIPETFVECHALRWSDLSLETRSALSGKLTGLWGAASDVESFESLAVDKQQALLLIMQRLQRKDLWDTVKRVDNIYGRGGVGMDFQAWPFLESTLSRRKDFTRRFAKRKSVSGGFYERERTKGPLHFLYLDGTPRIWHVHFDFYSPVASLSGALKHLRYEYVGKLKPDWRMIRKLELQLANSDFASTFKS